MRVVIEQDIAYTRQVLKFSAAEQATLRKAAELADQARTLWRATVDYDVEGEPLDTELAMIGIGADEIIDGIEIACENAPLPFFSIRG